MSLPFIDGNIYRFPDHEITWAGACPWTGAYCFGTESGHVLFCRNTGSGIIIDRSEVLAEEAINGVAYHNDLIGVSTRSEVILHRLRKGHETVELIFAGPGGAHGILATSDGLFVAPMGTAGLYCIETAPDFPPKSWIERASKEIYNYYQLSILGRSDSKNIFACSARTDGLLTIQIDKDSPSNSIVGLSSPKVDLVDVCSIGTPKWPFAVAALCLDRSLVFARNALSDEQPRTLRFEELRGTPYSILSTDGHIFVLTSQEIAVFPNLAVRYLNHEKLDRPIHYRKRAVRAVDAFIAHGTELLVLTDDGLNLFEISKLVHEGDEPKSGAKSPDTQSWHDGIDIPSQIPIIFSPWAA